MLLRSEGEKEPPVSKLMTASKYSGLVPSRSAMAYVKCCLTASCIGRRADSGRGCWRCTNGRLTLGCIADVGDAGCWYSKNVARIDQIRIVNVIGCHQIIDRSTKTGGDA